MMQVKPISSSQSCFSYDPHSLQVTSSCVLRILLPYPIFPTLLKDYTHSLDFIAITCVQAHSVAPVVSNSLQPYGPQHARFLWS